MFIRTKCDIHWYHFDIQLSNLDQTFASTSLQIGVVFNHSVHRIQDLQSLEFKKFRQRRKSSHQDLSRRVGGPRGPEAAVEVGLKNVWNMVVKRSKKKNSSLHKKFELDVGWSWSILNASIVNWTEWSALSRSTPSWLLGSSQSFVSILSAQWMKNLAAPASINFHETSKPLCMLETSTIHYHSEALILHTPARSVSFLFNNGATPGHSLSKNRRSQKPSGLSRCHPLSLFCIGEYTTFLKILLYFSQTAKTMVRWNPLPASQRDVLGHFLLYLLKSRARGIMVRDFQTGLYLCTWDYMRIMRYPLVMTNSLPWKEKITTLLIGKPSINGPSIPWLC